MSFTSTVKNEVSKNNLLATERISELSAMVANIGIIDKKIKIATENASVARHIFTLIKDLYDINAKITVRRGYNFTKNYQYILEISNKIELIKKDLNLDNKFMVPDEYMIADDELKSAYLRGLFQAIGSINDPKTARYHLEFLVDKQKYAKFVSELLNYFNLNSKILKRENKYMIYVKEAEKISDFLRVMGASNAVFYYEDIRIYRDHKNMTNRLNNCEQANVDKIIQTATEQVNDIELIKSEESLDLLDDKIKEACTYRLKYPDASLLELSEIISIETGNIITKSGLYHRFKKIKALADKIRELRGKQ